MEDDLTILGVVPSDRKKLENMGITTVEQIALMSVSSLGMGTSKGTMLVQRARNILANENILDIAITNGDLIEVTSKKTDRAIIKSILNVLDVYVVGWGNAALTIEGNVLKLSRKSEAFSKVISKAESLREILESKKMMNAKKAVGAGAYLESSPTPPSGTPSGACGQPQGAHSRCQASRRHSSCVRKPRALIHLAAPVRSSPDA